MICIVGASSTVSREVARLSRDVVLTCGRGKWADIRFDWSSCSYKDVIAAVPTDCEKYLITLGMLLPKNIVNQSTEEVFSSLSVNCLAVVELVERIFASNDRAAIVIIGSESAYKGSFDTTYFLAKAALVKYVELKKVRGVQRLVSISPSTISDTFMTTSREDQWRVEEYRKDHPKERLLSAEEVAKFVWQIFNSSDYLTNVDIRLDGGKFARV